MPMSWDVLSSGASSGAATRPLATLPPSGIGLCSPTRRSRLAGCVPGAPRRRRQFAVSYSPGLAVCAMSPVTTTRDTFAPSSRAASSAVILLRAAGRGPSGRGLKSGYSPQSAVQTGARSRQALPRCGLPSAGIGRTWGNSTGAGAGPVGERQAGEEDNWIGSVAPLFAHRAGQEACGYKSPRRSAPRFTRHERPRPAATGGELRAVAK